jgi:thiamine phosphate synthase YjbQ (UPF0047 family)
VFKVMTWNVENLFRPGADGGPDTQAVYQAKLHGLAETINSQAPDALSVQEIGDPAALADLVALLNGAWHQRVSGRHKETTPSRARAHARAMTER